MAAYAIRRSELKTAMRYTEFVGEERYENSRKKEGNGICPGCLRTDLAGGDRPVRPVHPVDLDVKIIIDDIPCSGNKG